MGSRPLETARAKESRVERLLAEYLRAWGLRDPSTIAQLCRTWVDRASAQSPAEAGSNVSLTTLYRAAMREAINDFDAWSDHLARIVFHGATPEPGAAGLVALELSALIDKYPQALFEYEAVPAEMLEQLARARRPVAPPVAPTTMHRQLLEHPATSTRNGWWKEILGSSTAQSRPRSGQSQG
ncbi:MAG TPA: hypothetical protein VG713_20860 [Pirellulales bacterium]|nr:hypothetical protein [Pirellulales bacterium]